jgi:acyl transferase domain-containing protein/acyl carrier protein
MADERHDPSGSEIAIIGMACRFPGASDVEQFWRNLCGSIESLTLLSDDELVRAGVDPALAARQDYVRRASVLDGIEMFDPAFFGYTPLEAKLMDPQHRLFLECAWEVFERAGYNPEQEPDPIGVFTGAKTNTYLFSLFSNRELFRTLDNFQIALGNDLGAMATRVSYKLNLRGPSYALHTACSTALVAVHLACQSLLLGECRMAVAGGAAVNVPQRRGYLYQRGGILSPDGSCRTFDEKSAGSNFGNGAGAVLLKRLADAVADGDPIHAVILGSAANNDGALKASYTAPGVEGQTAVLLDAMACAGVDADSISYVEAHGTATELGDSIEMLALTEAFRASTARRGFCAIGSVKTNVGHLETAAGVAGLIKTALALEHRRIPPSLHFERPNPRIDFASSPFYVATQEQEWATAGGPRRAGLSSFGIGSTNVHVILEEPPPAAPVTPSRPWQLLLLSARTETALETMTANLARRLRESGDEDLPDVAYTLQVGRKGFVHRRAVVCRDRAGAVAALEGGDPERVSTGAQDAAGRPVAFLFPGLGDHHTDMGLGLYRSERVFRETLDRCAELLRPHLGLDLREVIYPRGIDAEEESGGKPDLRSLFGRGGERSDRDEASRRLDETWLAQPALFAVEYALAQLWMAWGIRPQALLGYSLGEYVAACLAGVLSLEDALALVAQRARLIQDLEAGAMLALALPEEEAAPVLAELGLSLAAVTGPAASVAAGPVAAVAALEQRLGERGVACRRLSTTHAFHSAMMDGLAGPLTELVRGFALRPPDIPYISNVTGTWITAEEATDPGYWARHMCRPVRFGDGLNTLLDGRSRILLEVGPGQGLSSFVKQHPRFAAEAPLVVPSLRGSWGRQADLELVLATLGRLWQAGQPVSWPAFWGDETRRRVPLPTYPFERQRYWVDPEPEAMPAAPRPGALEKKPEVRDWFYLPVWKPVELPAEASAAEASGCWLVLSDAAGLGSRLAALLERGGGDVVVVRAGERLAEGTDGVWSVRPGSAEDWQEVLRALAARGRKPRRFAHLGSVGAPAPAAPETSGEDLFRQAQEVGFYSLIALSQALGRQGVSGPLRIDAVSSRVQNVTGDEPLAPERSTLLGACLVIPQEHPNITCRSIDLLLSDAMDLDEVAGRLCDELLASPEHLFVAHRGDERRVQSFEPLPVEAGERPVFRARGVYLITGGLGGIGLVLARHLASEAQARLVLTRRTPLPPRETWDRWLEEHGREDAVSRTIVKVRELEELGAELLVASADVADEAAMRSVVSQALERFGALHGVIHAAGVLDPASFKTVQQTTRMECEMHFHPKVYGLYVLERVLAGLDLDFCLLYSSLSAVLGGLGYVGYATANLFMDFFAHRHNRSGGTPWTSVDWDSWHYQEPGEQESKGGIGATLVELAVTPEEGIEAVCRVLALDGHRHIVMSTGELQPRIDQWVQLKAMRAAAEDGGGRAGAPSVLPRGGELERRIREIWQRALPTSTIGLHDNFFDLGGNSLTGMQLIADLNRELGTDLTPVQLFDAPTVAALATLLEPAAPAEMETAAAVEAGEAADGWEIAVIGMAGRFPGAASVDELWRNVCDGVEAIRFFSDEELLAAGVPAELLRDPLYVRARGVLDGIEQFDASFFGVTPREAEVMDPQHRLFLECAWEALENAGQDPASFRRPIGTFAGSSISSYLQNLYTNPDVIDSVGEFQVLISNEKDSLPMRVSYKLDLRGPSLSVQTFCSTSLVAVHLACRSLLAGECDMALAGGVSLITPQTSGYLYEEGSFSSADGHVRTFDAKARGIVFGNGMGVVVLKPLRRALADGDNVRAVIRGSAINNDGSLKVGYTAPSGEGQLEVIQAALRAAHCHPETIRFVECHGTATPLGDPIEVGALTRAWRAWTDKTGFCALGSVKTNIGHLDRAAGVTGLIKAVLALEHGEIPGILHFEEPNPQIDFAASPFYVNTALSPWPASGGPRRAAVSSFGVGGTNAHVILEQAPALPVTEARRPWQLLVLSAKTPTALKAATARLSSHLAAHPQLPLADVAFTLQAGRRAFAHRRSVVCNSAGEAVTALAGGDPRQPFTAAGRDEAPRPVFLFPGLGAQYVDMARGLYRDEPVFRASLDRSCELLERHLGVDLREVLYPHGAEREDAAAAGRAVDLRRMLQRESEPEDAATSRLKQTFLSQPAVFAVEYSLACLWLEWGVHPTAMTGYSIGELTAACLAGVLSLEDAAALVARRAQLIAELPEGAMTAVSLPEEVVLPLLGAELSLSGINGPEQTVVAGPAAAVAELEERLATLGAACRRLQTTHAFHSRMLEPAFDALVELVSTFALQPPRIPYLSNVTGTWITAEEATDPTYWARHMVQPVRFADIAAELLSDASRAYLEVGPGQTLTSLILQHPASGAAGGRPPLALASLRHAFETQSDQAFLLHTLGRYWTAGGKVEWAGFWAGEQRRRIPLPSYPFERQRHWIEAAPRSAALARTAAGSLGERLQALSWRRSPSLPPWPPAGHRPERHTWLLFLDELGVGELLADRLERLGQDTVRVKKGDGFARPGDRSFVLDPQDPAGYEALLATMGALPDRVFHLWGLGAAPGEAVQGRGFGSLLWLADAAARLGEARPCSVWGAVEPVHDVIGGERLRPEEATVLGSSEAISRFWPGLARHVVDVETPRNGGVERLAAQLLAEAGAAEPAPLVAYRNGQRWLPAQEDLPGAGGEKRLWERGVYLVCGGLSPLGFQVAEHLAREAKAALVLLASAGSEDSGEAERITALERLGAEVLVVKADLDGDAEVGRVLEQVYRRFGGLHGVVYVAEPALPWNEKEAFAAIVREVERGVGGLLALDDALRGKFVDFGFLLTAAREGSAAELGLSHFLDAFATERAARTDGEGIRWSRLSLDRLRGDAVAQAQHLLPRLFSLEVPCAVVEPPARAAAAPAAPAAAVGEETETSAPPRNNVERTIAAIWQELLGRPRVGIHDNFLDLGGDSLLATRLIARLRTELGVNLPVRMFFEGSTVAVLAEAVEKARSEAMTDTPEDDEADALEILQMLEGLTDEQVALELANRRGAAE